MYDNNNNIDARHYPEVEFHMIHESDWLDIEDNMELIDGSEGYRKDDRLFGTKQGSRHRRLQPHAQEIYQLSMTERSGGYNANNTEMALLHHRRKRILGANNRGQYQLQLPSDMTSIWRQINQLANHMKLIH